MTTDIIQNQFTEVVIKYMLDYKAMYFKLQARIADAIEMLEDAQRECEDEYIEAESEEEIKDLS